jgi:hypothetical protein
MNASARKLLSQRRALEQLHHGVGGAVDDTEIEDREDVRVGQRSDHLCFAFEPRERGPILGELRRQHLDRNLAVELGIARAVDLAHAPGAQRREDFIRSQPGSLDKRHARIIATRGADVGARGYNPRSGALHVHSTHARPLARLRPVRRDSRASCP